MLFVHLKLMLSHSQDLMLLILKVGTRPVIPRNQKLTSSSLPMCRETFFNVFGDALLTVSFLTLGNQSIHVPLQSVDRQKSIDRYQNISIGKSKINRNRESMFKYRFNFQFNDMKLFNSQ